MVYTSARHTIRTNTHIVTCGTTRLAASVCQPRHDQMEQGPIEPHAGRSTFLLNSGGAGGGYYRDLSRKAEWSHRVQNPLHPSILKGSVQNHWVSWDWSAKEGGNDGQGVARRARRYGGKREGSGQRWCCFTGARDMSPHRDTRTECFQTTYGVGGGGVAGMSLSCTLDAADAFPVGYGYLGSGRGCFGWGWGRLSPLRVNGAGWEGNRR